MSAELIFVPLLLQLLLPIYLYFALAAAKKKALAAGEVDLERRGVYDDAWPKSVALINNSIRNQFEMPVLFYVVILTLWALDGINMIVHAFAWIYILSRFAHAYVHTGSNYVPLRLKFFSVSALSVLALIIVAAITLAS